MSLIIIFFFIILATSGLCFLQVFLSRKKSKWPGLILPAVFILLSLIWVSYFLKMSDRVGPNIETPETRYEYDSKGNIKEEFKKVDGHVSFDRHSRPRVIISGFGLITILITTNIPTVIYLLIYGISREKMRARLEMQKMAIQDLN